MIYTIIIAGLVIFTLERLMPANKLPRVRGWWLRVVIINGIQLGIVLLGAKTWDIWFQKVSLLNQGAYMHPALGGAIAYLVSTFVYYWWHRARHDSRFLWLTFHQVHHSPTRIETITSFYKHPAEIIANSLLTGVIAYVLLGVGVEGAAYNLLYSALGEYFYHMNISTPRWVGWFLQRPEMHRVHHQEGVHYYNFADLPVWDMLFGTYKNPERFEGRCGFEENREARLGAMFAFRDVNQEAQS